MSRSALPKQLLPLVSDKSMLQETLLRLSGLPGMGQPVLVCGNDHRFLVAEQLREIDISPLAIMLEPVGRNTAPAIAAAALCVQQNIGDAIMLVLPADHVIQDVAAFHRAIEQASMAAQAGRLVTFGIRPSHPETGYGYICQGDPLTEHGDVHEVSRFVEKPDIETAKGYLASGHYFWNSGMFLFRPEVYLAELLRWQPDMHRLVSQAYEESYRDLDFCRLAEKPFADCPSDSIDYAVMERTALAAVIPVEMGWSDVGSWASLWSVLECDDDGNCVRGDVYVDSSRDSLIRAEKRFVAAIGVRDLVIVETSDAVLVAHKDCAQSVKKVVDHLKSNQRGEHEYHTRVYRPWGWYEGIDAGQRFQVKRIMVKPGERLSLQMHHHRAEHWVVVSGTASVTCNEETRLVSENQSVYIPIGSKHRLDNPGKLPLHLIEVQSGGYLDEDDIVRFEDMYQRS